jgi:hypothetical protein
MCGGKEASGQPDVKLQRQGQIGVPSGFRLYRVCDVHSFIHPYASGDVMVHCYLLHKLRWNDKMPACNV